MGARVAVEDYDYSMFSIVGGSAAGDTQALHDGSPATQCAMIWPAGAQTTATTVLIPFSVSIVDGPVPTNLQFFGLLNVTGLPVGLKVELVSGAGPTPGTVRATGELVEFATGQIGVWFLLEDDEAFDDTSVGFLLYNDVGGVAVVDASEEYAIGEVVAAAVHDWCVAEIDLKPVDPSITNYPSQNQPKRLMREPFREVTISIAPRSFDVAFVQADSLVRDLFKLARLSTFAICVRPERRGGAIDPDYVNATSMLATIKDLGGLRSNAAMDRWPTQIIASENL